MTSRQVKWISAAVAAAVLATGCAPNLSRQVWGGPNKVRVGDALYIGDSAERRYILSVERNENGAGSDRGRTRQITCAEPSPDVAKATSEAISKTLSASGSGNRTGGNDSIGDVEAQAELNVASSRAVAESLAQLGQRGATVQLLRDLFYRACEAYANGAIDESMYAIILSRTDDITVTLLTAELMGSDNVAPPAMIAAPVARAGSDSSNDAANGGGFLPGGGAGSDGLAGSRSPMGGTDSGGGRSGAPENQVDALLQLQHRYLNDLHSPRTTLGVTCVTVLNQISELGRDPNAPLAQICREYMSNSATSMTQATQLQAVGYLISNLSEAGYSAAEIERTVNQLLAAGQ